jgi:hypothetical protein
VETLTAQAFGSPANVADAQLQLHQLLQSELDLFRRNNDAATSAWISEQTAQAVDAFQSMFVQEAGSYPIETAVLDSTNELARRSGLASLQQVEVVLGTRAMVEGTRRFDAATAKWLSTERLKNDVASARSCLGESWYSASCALCGWVRCALCALHSSVSRRFR